MENSFLLQNQVKNNAEDLQKEHIDLQNWEEDMRKKDQLLLNTKVENNESITLPIRSKKVQDSKKVNATEQNGSKCQKSSKITTTDYAAWDKFDVDKACKDIDEDHDDTESKHQNAEIFKQQGNEFFKTQNWVKAIQSYSKAISIFNKDPTFYANRSMCYLKMNNLHSALSDCTKAIEFDKYYVKAYHRRAMANFELQRYEEAKKDLDFVLKIEPGNKDSKALLAEVMKKSSRKEKNSLLSKSMVEERNPTKNELKLKSQTNTMNNSIEKICSKPSWLPELQSDVSTINPKVTGSSYINEDFRRVKVKEISPNKSIFDDVMKLQNKKCRLEENQCNLEVNTSQTLKTMNCNNEDIVNSEVQEIPSIPKTSIEFFSVWNGNTSLDFRYQYLKQISPKTIPNIFKDAFEVDTFSQILLILKLKFLPLNERIFEYLKYLSYIKRFKVLMAFVSSNDKEVLKNLFDYCLKEEKKSETEITDLRLRYEL